MLKIGITGGIGSGKSTVCNLFKSLGIVVYDSDIRARIITDINLDIRKGIIDLFGEESYVDNKLNRKFISPIVFNDKEKLEKLNSIVHPQVKEDFLSWIEQHKEYPYIIKESAIMFETDAYKNMDKNITVSAPIDIRINRIISRDPQRTDKEIKNIIAKQLSDVERIKKSDYVIYNDNTKELLPQIIELDKLFRNASIKKA